MPFAFSQVRPLDTGLYARDDVGLGQYLGVAFEQGVSDSAFNSIMEMTEFSIYDEGRLMSREEANDQYGMVGLKFDGPIREDRARLLRERREAQMRRDYYMMQGAPGGLTSRRGLAGLGASMLGSMMNPLDFSLNFLPIVGSEAAAVKMASLGRGAFRQTLARGLVTTEEALTRAIPVAPRLTSSLIQGFVGNVAAEIPHFITTVQSNEDYTLGQAITNVAAGTAIGGAIHLGVTAASKIFDRVSGPTKEAMFRRALDQTLKGEDISVHEFVKIDDNLIREKVRFNEQVARQTAIDKIPEAELQEAVKGKLGDVGELKTAVRYPDGKVKPMAYAEMLTEGERNKSGLEFGWMTKDGRFLTTDEMLVATGLRGELTPAETASLNDPTMRGPDQSIFDEARLAGAMEEDAMAAVRESRRQRSEDAFWTRPEAQKLLDEERERRVQDFMSKERERYDEEGAVAREAREEIRRQVADGKVLTDDVKKKWLVNEGHDKAIVPLDEQTAEVKQDLDAQLKDLTDEIGELSEEERGYLADLEAEMKAADEGAKEIDASTKKVVDGIEAAANCLKR